MKLPDDYWIDVAFALIFGSLAGLVFGIFF